MRALLLVDVQNDFLPGGALPVPQGDEVIPVINRVQPRFELVVATQDWHPPTHGSFAANHPGRKIHDQIDLNGLPQTLWPVHCLQNSAGAQLAMALKKDRICRIFQKGTDASIDSYSGFFDNAHRKSTGLGNWLKDQRVSDLYVCGLATDYCVKFTVLDALQLGFAAFLIEDACRGVDLKPGDVAAAIKQMESTGATIVCSNAIHS